jgi:hypothetical protein
LTTRLQIAQAEPSRSLGSSGRGYVTGSDNVKTCPFCAEEIQEAAIVCKHCGRDLVAKEMPSAPEPWKTKEERGRKSDRDRAANFAVFIGAVAVFICPWFVWVRQDGTLTIRTGFGTPFDSSAQLDYTTVGYQMFVGKAALVLAIVLFGLGLLSALLSGAARSWISVSIVVAGVGCVLLAVAGFLTAQGRVDWIRSDIAAGKEFVAGNSSIQTFQGQADFHILLLGVGILALGGVVAAAAGFALRKEIHRAR